jgi:hypothetical protein
MSALVALGCGGAAETGPGAETSQDQAEPGKAVDIEAMFRREIGELAVLPVKAPDGSWTAAVPAKSAPKVATEDNVVVVLIPIGTVTPVQCQVHAEAIDPGGMINQVLSGAAEKVELKAVAPWAVTVSNDAPAAWVEASYLAQQRGVKAAGHLKLAVNPRPERPLFCFHDEVGYKASFQRVVGAFFDSFKTTTAAQEQPLYLEVQTAHLDQIPIGFSSSRLTKLGEGRRWTTASLTMMPVGQAELKLDDDYSIRDLDANHVLASGRWVEASDGEITLNIQVERVKGNLYRYEGQLQGKQLKGEFKTKSKQGIPGDLATAAVLKKRLANGKAFSFTQEEYSPSLNATAPHEVTYRRDVSDPPRAIKLKAGEMEMVGLVDDQGMVSAIQLSMGPRKIHFKRQIVKGKL